jgi:hypothetical protein
MSGVQRLPVQILCRLDAGEHPIFKIFKQHTTFLDDGQK